MTKKTRKKQDRQPDQAAVELTGESLLDILLDRVFVPKVQTIVIDSGKEGGR